MRTNSPSPGASNSTPGSLSADFRDYERQLVFYCVERPWASWVALSMLTYATRSQIFEHVCYRASVGLAVHSCNPRTPKVYNLSISSTVPSTTPVLTTLLRCLLRLFEGWLRRLRDFQCTCVPWYLVEHLLLFSGGADVLENTSSKLSCIAARGSYCRLYMAAEPGICCEV